MSGWREEMAWLMGDAAFVLLLFCLLPIALFASALGEKGRPPHPTFPEESHEIRFVVAGVFLSLVLG